MIEFCGGKRPKSDLNLEMAREFLDRDFFQSGPFQLPESVDGIEESLLHDVHRVDVFAASLMRRLSSLSLFLPFTMSIQHPRVEVHCKNVE